MTLHAGMSEEDERTIREKQPQMFRFAGIMSGWAQDDKGWDGSFAFPGLSHPSDEDLSPGTLV
jgi:hypothetical protein